MKIVRYSFPIRQNFTVGTEKRLSVAGQPESTFRPVRLQTNAPAPELFFLHKLQIGSRQCLVAPLDLYNFNPPAPCPSCHFNVGDPVCMTWEGDLRHGRVVQGKGCHTVVWEDEDTGKPLGLYTFLPDPRVAFDEGCAQPDPCRLELPTLHSSWSLSAEIFYTGKEWPEVKAREDFALFLSFSGPAIVFEPTEPGLSIAPPTGVPEMVLRALAHKSK